VLKVSCDELSILLTGDAGPEAQQRMLQSGSNLASTVLKVPHHGAAEGLDPQFLAAVHPQIAILSVGRSNRYGHPAPGILRMLQASKIYRTDEDGTISISIRDHRIELFTSPH
jgi:competence protein ComEC